MIYWNWIIFGILCLILYFNDRILRKLLLKTEDIVKATTIDNEMKDIKTITYKTLEEQKRYLDLMDNSNKMFGDFFNKIIFLIFMFIVFFIGMDYFKGLYIIPFSIVFSLIVPLIYIYKKRCKSYNYFSMFFMLIFFSGFISIQSIDPLYIYNLRINIFYVIPFMILIPLLIKLIQEKIFKR